MDCSTGLVVLLSGCSDAETHKYTEVTAFNFIQGMDFPAFTRQFLTQKNTLPQT